MRSSNNGGHGIRIEIVKVIKANEDKNVKWICGFENKLIIFIYYLNCFLL